LLAVRVKALQMLESFASPHALAEAAATAAHNALTAAIAERGTATLVATGGRSPAPAYDLLSRALLDWSAVTVTLSDDRFVPASSHDSNQRLVQEHLLVDKARSARFVGLVHPDETLERSAELADAAVRPLAPFDIMLLGMGEDGHVASLIPGSPAMDQGLDPAGDRFCLPVPAGLGSPPLARITLTLPALIRARHTLILISGAAKRRIIEDGTGLPVHALLEQAKAPVRVLWTP
jgi:6-phosphogluconolactonase